MAEAKLCAVRLDYGHGGALVGGEHVAVGECNHAFGALQIAADGAKVAGLQPESGEPAAVLGIIHTLPPEEVWC